MSWNAGAIPQTATPAERKMLAAYQAGQPLRKRPAPAWRGPTEPYEYFYVSLGYAREVPRNYYDWKERIGRPTTIIRGRETTVAPELIKAMWGDTLWIDGRGWVDYWQIVKEGYGAEDQYGARI